MGKEHLKPGGLMQELTISTSVVTLSMAGVPPDRVIAWDLRGGPVRMAMDGTDPTATRGQTISDLAKGEWSQQAAAAMKFIRDSTAGADAKLTATPCAYVK